MVCLVERERTELLQGEQTRRAEDQIMLHILYGQSGHQYQSKLAYFVHISVNVIVAMAIVIYT